jgi:hypothetical protein
MPAVRSTQRRAWGRSTTHHDSSAVCSARAAVTQKSKGDVTWPAKSLREATELNIVTMAMPQSSSCFSNQLIVIVQPTRRDKATAGGNGCVVVPGLGNAPFTSFATAQNSEDRQRPSNLYTRAAGAAADYTVHTGCVELLSACHSNMHAIHCLTGSQDCGPLHLKTLECTTT